MCWLCLVFITATVTHLTSRQFFGIVIEVINVGAKGLEVRDNKLLPEGLGEQNDVALNTSRRGNNPKDSALCCGSRSHSGRAGLSLITSTHTSVSDSGAQAHSSNDWALR